MRRTALAVTAAALLAAVPLLSSCSGEPHAGAAVVFSGGERITVSQLQSQVADVRAAQEGSEQAEELISQSGDLTLDTLNTMIQGRVIEQAAAEHGVRVRPGQIQRARAAETRQAGGKEQLESTYLQQFGLAPGELDTHYERQLMVQGLIKKLGIDPQSQEGQARLGELLINASKDLGVDVSPRYGSWDNSQVRLAQAKTPWLKQVTATEQAGTTGQQ